MCRPLARNFDLKGHQTCKERAPTTLEEVPTILEGAQ